MPSEPMPTCPFCGKELGRERNAKGLFYFCHYVPCFMAETGIWPEERWQQLQRGVAAAVEKAKREAALEGMNASTKVFEAGLKDAVKAEREKCIQEIRDKCTACNDGVYDVDAEGDAVECEYCGRPMAALREGATDDVN